MSKTVLLARSHPFIVQEMKPLLEQCGYDVLKPESVARLDTQTRSCDAVAVRTGRFNHFRPVGKLGIAVRLVGVSSSNSMSSINSALSVLYLAKDELTDLVTREQAKQLLQRHVR